jgi:hypothetical protein
MSPKGGNDANTSCDQRRRARVEYRRLGANRDGVLERSRRGYSGQVDDGFGRKQSRDHRGALFQGRRVAAKQLVTETFPNARSVGVMVNPNSPNAASQIEDLQVAAAVLHKELFVAKAASETDLERAFSALAQARVGAAIVLADTLFTNRPDHLVTLGC